MISLEYIEKVYVQYTKEVLHVSHLSDGSLYMLVRESLDDPKSAS